jgi:GNAT superfamily N-acetyltransferase
VTVRLACDADIPALASIELSAGELFAGTHMAWAVGQATPPEQLRVAIARGDVWLVEDGRVPVACLIGERMDGDFHIDELSVAQSHQRRGIGRCLMEAAVEEARRRGHRAATLTTDRTLPWNAPYYQRLGFVILGQGETPPGLAARLASQPNRDKRCAMRLPL